MVPEIWSATEIFLILGHFCPFIHLAIWKIKILIKWKMPGDMIILHICTINENHMMCASWCRECEKIFSYFGPFFALLPPNNPQNQNFEKIKKNTWRYHHFTQMHQKPWSCEYRLRHMRRAIARAHLCTRLKR